MGSLVDALLLDPAPLNFWVAARTDGIKGSGVTPGDPFNGSTADRFDSIMNTLPMNCRVYLGPGTFSTQGYASGVTGGFQPKRGMKIIGSGIGVTKILIAPNPNATNAHYFAFGHDLASGGQPNLMDDLEISDLTIDCRLFAQGGSQAACGAVRIMGNHAKVRRIRAINWGTKNSTNPCFVIAVLTADPGSGVNEVVNSGIEDCIAISPDSNNVGPVIVLHAGRKQKRRRTSRLSGELLTSGTALWIAAANPVWKSARCPWGGV